MHLFRLLLGFLFPTTCAYCRSPIGSSSVPFFCAACWSDFAPLTGPVCPRCGRQFDSPEALNASPDHACGACRVSTPVFDQALSAGLFEGPLREAVHRFKYRPCRSLGAPLAAWMAAQIAPVSSIDVVIPVPLHRKRLRQRGFNQALLLASGFAGSYGLPLSYDNLVRIRFTAPQVELSGAERIRNVAGAFALARPGDILDRRVLLVDDVFTTGATLNECSRVLTRAGAASVTALTLARAL